MKKVIKWSVIGLLAVSAAAAIYTVKNKGAEASVITLAKGEIEQYTEDTAQVRPVGRQTVYMEGSGKIEAVYADVGDAVKKGDLLLSLEKSDLELQLRDAGAKVDAATAQLQGTELKSYANQIEQARVSADQAQNTYDASKGAFDNTKILYEAGAVSKKELDGAEDALKAASSALEVSKLQLENVKNGAPDYLKRGYRAQLEQAVIYRDTILRNLEKQELKAPFDGVILERLADENSPAVPGAPAFVIGDAKNLELEARILADDAGKIKIGDTVEISGKPIGDEKLTGKVEKIAPAAETVTSPLGVDQKRVPVTISITDKTGKIKPGYDLDIKIITQRKKDIIKVPDSAVFDYKGESRVFVLENGRAKLRTVKKGLLSGDDIEITEGLKEGEAILKDPGNDIKEGIRIKPV